MAANTPRLLRLSHRVFVVATVLMIAICMMILYMRGAYSTSSKVYLVRKVSSFAAASAVSDFPKQVAIMVLFSLAQVATSAPPVLQKRSHAVFRVCSSI